MAGIQTYTKAFISTSGRRAVAKTGPEPEPETPFPIPPANIVHYWDFDEAAGQSLTDIAGTNTGTGVNTVAVEGKLGNARRLLLANSSRINFAKPAPVNAGMTESFSVTMWVKLLSETPYMCLLAMQDGTLNYLSITTDAGGWVTARIWVGGEESYQWISESDENPCPAGDWHFLATTWDAAENEFKFYIDGILQEYPWGDYLGLGNGSYMMIGGSNAGYYADMEVDQVIVASGVITPEQVLELYKNGEGVSLQV